MTSKKYEIIKKSEISSTAISSSINVIFKLLTNGLISSDTTVADFSRMCNEYLDEEREVLRNKSNDYKLD